MYRLAMIRFHKFEIPELSLAEIEKQFKQEYLYSEMYVREGIGENTATIEVSASVSTTADKNGVSDEFEYTSKRLCDAYDAIKRRLGHYKKD